MNKLLISSFAKKLIIAAISIMMVMAPMQYALASNLQLRQKVGTEIEQDARAIKTPSFRISPSFYLPDQGQSLSQLTIFCTPTQPSGRAVVRYQIDSQTVFESSPICKQQVTLTNFRTATFGLYVNNNLIAQKQVQPLLSWDQLADHLQSCVADISQRTGPATTNTVNPGVDFRTEIETAYSSYINLNSDQVFINRLYECVLFRPADPAGAQFWLQALTQNRNRTEILRNFLDSQEFFIVAQKFYRGLENNFNSSVNIKPLVYFSQERDGLNLIPGAVIDPNNSNTQLPIKFTVDTSDINQATQLTVGGSGMANQDFPLIAGSNGNHSFILKIPNSFRGNTNHTLYFYAQEVLPNGQLSSDYRLVTSKNFSIKPFNYQNEQPFDTLDFFLSDYASVLGSTPGVGLTGTHKQSQTVDLANKTSYYVKFGEPGITSARQSFEKHKWDDQNIYLVEDVSDAATSTIHNPGTIMKRAMKPGDSVDLRNTSPGTTVGNGPYYVELDRVPFGPCSVKNISSQFPEGKLPTWAIHTLLAHVPDYNFQGDIGNQDTIVVDYNYDWKFSALAAGNTTGPFRLSEVNYYSRQHGWARWQYYADNVLIQTSNFNRLDPDQPNSPDTYAACTNR